MDQPLDLQTVSELTGLDADAIQQAIESGRFPRPLPMGPWDTKWSSDAIREWVAERQVNR